MSLRIFNTPNVLIQLPDLVSVVVIMLVGPKKLF